MTEEKLRTLFKKQKGIIKTAKKLRPHKPNVVILLRNNETAEFYENQKKKKFNYVHLDGTHRDIILRNKFRMPYGNDEFTCYICHEDHPISLPYTPAIISEEHHTALENAMVNVNKLKADIWKGKGEFAKQIAIGLAIIMGVIIGAWLIAPEMFDRILGTTQPVVQQVQLLNRTGG